ATSATTRRTRWSSGKDATMTLAPEGSPQPIIRARRGSAAGAGRFSFDVADREPLVIFRVVLVVGAPLDAGLLQDGHPVLGEGVAAEVEQLQAGQVGTGGQRARPLVGDRAQVQIEDSQPLQDTTLDDLCAPLVAQLRQAQAQMAQAPQVGGAAEGVQVLRAY